MNISGEVNVLLRLEVLKLNCMEVLVDKFCKDRIILEVYG